MNTQDNSNDLKPDQPNPLQITGDTKPSVPVFSCIVYLSKNDAGQVTGRVANLEGIKAIANTERDVLLKVSKEFRSQVLKLYEAGEDVPWIDPPATQDEHEQVKTIPMHL